MRDIRTHYGQWRGRRDEPRIAVEAEPTAGAERHLEWDAETPPRMMIGYRTPSFDGGRRGAQRTAALRETAALQVLHALLFSSSAPLYQRLVVQRQRVLDLSSWAGLFSRDPNLFVAQATLKPGVTFDEIGDGIQNEIAGIVAGNVPAERIADVRQHLRYAMLMELEKPGDAAELIGRFIAVSGDVRDVDAYTQALSQVTAEDVARVARLYLTPTRRFVVMLSTRTEAPSEAAPTTQTTSGAAQ